VESVFKFSVDEIGGKLLIVNDANDPRVIKTKSDQIVVALRDKGQTGVPHYRHCLA